jgi:hypothetical protein
MSNDKLPEPVQPQVSQPHVSEAQATTYQDPNAPKPKRKVHKGIIAVLLVLVVLIAGSVFAYTRFAANKDDATALDDYSGGIAEPELPQSQVTAETEVAKKFLQAIQAKDSATVEQLAADSLKQANDTNTTILSLYEGKFDGIDFSRLVSTVTEADSDTGVVGKRVVFSDAAGEGSTGTYRTEVLVTTENGSLRIANVTTGLEL